MDIWYKSVKMFGSIRHLSHEISYFTHYDYDSLDNTFYITKPEEITQLRIIQDGENECTLMEVHKAISGMIACTWVKNLQQLICLSLNNIFYRICFDTAASASKDNSKEIKVEYENFSTLYALTTKKLKELLSKAQIMADLMEQPKKLHEAVEIEWQKQQLLSLGFKEIWKTICKCHIEYHMESTITYSHKEEDLVIKTSFDHRDHDNDEANSMYCLIFVKLTSKDNLFLSIIQTATWHLQITLEGETLILLLPSNMINKRLCFIVKFSTKSHRGMLPDFSLNLLTFVSHCSVYLCINDSIDVTKTEQTYRHLFSSRSQITLFRNSNLNVDTILQKFNGQQTDGTLCDNAEKPLIKQVFKGLSKQEIISVLELFHQQFEDILNSDIKIYYLREHILHLSYEETLQELSISTTYPEALLYFKLFIMYEFKSSKNVDLTDSKTTSLQKIMVSFIIRKTSSFFIPSLFGEERIYHLIRPDL